MSMIKLLKFSRPTLSFGKIPFLEINGRRLKKTDIAFLSLISQSQRKLSALIPYPPQPSRSSSGSSDEEKINCVFGNIDNYTITTRIGHGKYSNVFMGHNNRGQPVVIKVLKPVRVFKINREIKILKQMIGAPNTSQLIDIVKDPDSGYIALIIDWANNSEVRSIFKELTSDDIAIYIYKVLQALSFAHQKGIMHRDIKPGNIMFDINTKEVHVIDWGLAEFYHPGEEYQVRVATRHYKGPELLLGYQKYTPSLDIWCLGCTLASLLFHRVPFFHGRENDEQFILKIARVRGGRSMLNYIDRIGAMISKDARQEMQDMPPTPWSKWINDENKKNITADALDLLSQMLTIDHAARPSAEECMNHSFFNNIRSFCN